MKFFNLRIRNVKNATIHEDMGRGTLWDPPLGHGTKFRAGTYSFLGH